MSSIATANPLGVIWPLISTVVSGLEKLSAFSISSASSRMTSITACPRSHAGSIRWNVARS